MSLVGIISDIHGNLEALRAVLRAMDKDGAELLIHLGDLVGYNANPSECLNLVRSRKVVSVLGNHDLAALDPKMAESFNIFAHQAIMYTRRQLSGADLRYIHSIPRIDVLWDKYLCCHGTPASLESYISNLFQAKRTFNLLQKHYKGIHVCFFGHTHMQKLWIRDPRGKVSLMQNPQGAVKLNPDVIYLINPGSVGQPRQKDNRAHYILLDTAKQCVWLKAVPYEIKKAQAKIIAAGLPEYLAKRLEDGI